jgi:hypothetical protein
LHLLRSDAGDALRSSSERHSQNSASHCGAVVSTSKRFSFRLGRAPPAELCLTSISSGAEFTCDRKTSTRRWLVVDRLA